MTATCYVKPPTAMDFHADNVAEEWTRWEKQWKVFYTAAELDAKVAATRVAIVLNTAGSQALYTYSTFEFAPAANENPAEDPNYTDTVFKTIREIRDDVRFSWLTFNCVP